MSAPGPCHKCGAWIADTEPCAWIDPPEWDAKRRPVCVSCAGGFDDTPRWTKEELDAASKIADEWGKLCEPIPPPN